MDLTDEQIEEIRQYQNSIPSHKNKRNDIVKFMKSKGYGGYNECFEVYKELRREGKLSSVDLLEGEEFRQYSEHYYVSNKGRIMSTIRADRILTTFNVKGYRRVYLSEGDKGAYRYVHRMVAETFIPNPDNKPFVDHIDTNRSNNCVENLKWVDSIENMNNELTRMHVSMSKGCSSYGFKIYVGNEETGEYTILNSMAELYRYLGLTYIPKFVGTQTYGEYTIVMAGEDKDEYYIGKMLRQGATKEELIEKVKNYSESAEFHKYIKQLEQNEKDNLQVS